ncbi:DUF4157 domain-containing protein [Streptomyces sp. NBC_00076]|uniref:eCIS core domain-containing protein n=1 Tax=Streptomyces sp. NBC_00076 TaxID=2975642 RepID=UPI0032495CCB
MRAHGTRAQQAGDQGQARRVSAPSGPAHRLLTLQRMAGNAAVARAIEEERHENAPGCGHTQSAVEQSTASQSGAVQQSAAPQSAVGEPVVQRRSSVDEAVASPWQPLDARIRATAEQAYGMDLGHVRVHTGPVAQRSATELGALAYTTGAHIVSASPKLDDETIYHEIDHVRQQSLGPVAGTDNGAGAKVSSPNDAFEVQSAANGRRLAQGAAPELGVPGSVQRATGPGAAPVQRVRSSVTAGTSTRRGRVRVESLPLFISAPEYTRASPRAAGGAMSKAILGPRSLFGMGTDADSRLPAAIDDARDKYNIPFIAGHLLNADFGGDGTAAANLTILTPRANSAHKRFDNPVKVAVGYLKDVYEHLSRLYVPIDRLGYGIAVKVGVSGPSYVWSSKYPGNCISQYLSCEARVMRESQVYDYYDRRDPGDRDAERKWDAVLALMDRITALVEQANDNDLVDNEAR